MIDYDMLPDGWLAVIGERLRRAAEGDYVLDGVPEPYRCWRTYAATLTAMEAFRRSGFDASMRAST